jgi:hypothetical protein
MRRMASALARGLGFFLLLASVCASQTGPPQPNRLATARVIYVEPMPDQLDQWLIQDLRAWGRYQIASSEQGVDLVISAKKPEKHIHFTKHQTPPILRRQHKTPPVLSVTVVDWVTGARMWQADILNVSPKKNQTPQPGPKTEIYAGHMTPDQIAERCTNLLRRYVKSLEQAPKH